MTLQTTCPACDATAATSALRHPPRSVPQHSCLLVASRQEAMEFPRGDIELWHCSACGFVFNRLFDPATQNFSATYEETQEFSPCFTHFADSLVRRLIERHDLRGKRVLEIGCGKGQFLTPDPAGIPRESKPPER